MVAAPPADVNEVRGLLDTYELPKAVSVVPGGSSRQESVRVALVALPRDVDVVLVHDAARPLVPVDLVDAVAAAVRAGATAVVPVLPLTDTVKRVDAGGQVISTVDRDTLRAAQTPQGFRRDVLASAHAAADGADLTDDAALVERMGGTVTTIPGSVDAIKVTRPVDLAIAETLLTRRRGDHGR